MIHYYMLLIKEENQVKPWTQNWDPKFLFQLGNTQKTTAKKREIQSVKKKWYSQNFLNVFNEICSNSMCIWYHIKAE